MHVINGNSAKQKAFVLVFAKTLIYLTSLGEKKTQRRKKKNTAVQPEEKKIVLSPLSRNKKCQGASG